MKGEPSAMITRLRATLQQTKVARSLKQFRDAFEISEKANGRGDAPELHAWLGEVDSFLAEQKADRRAKWKQLRNRFRLHL